MHVPDIELHAAGTPEEASASAVQYSPRARLLAGGTDLLVDLKTGRVEVEHLISISRLHGLRGVSLGEDGLHIGSLTTISELGGSAAVGQRYGALLDATGQMANWQIRNVATVGGNLASAVPCADLPPIMMSMNARVALRSATGQRSEALEAFFAGPRQTVRRHDELLSAVVIPAPPAGFGAAYARLALRGGNGIAVASVAASLTLADHDTIRDARVVLGAVAPTPKLVPGAAAVLVGQTASERTFADAARTAAEASEPISDVRGSADYRRRVVEVLARRALASALRRAREENA